MTPQLPIMGALLLTPLAAALADARPDRPPFDYLPAEAHHVLPETHNEESGYFSLSQGHDGNVYVGTAKYGVNAFLVQFEPRSREQRIVIDTHAACGLDTTGMAAQAKIHTRNHVADSGRIYVGSKQGYPRGEEQRHTDYPGGYVMRYDPRADEAECLGRVPVLGHGVIDVVADELRNTLYLVVHHDATRGALWMHRPIESDGPAQWQGLYDAPTFYGQTLLDRRGHAHVLGRNGELVSYDPDADALRVRPMKLDGDPFEPPPRAPPTWILGPDRRTAYLVYMTSPMLYRVDLEEEDEDRVTLEALGPALDSDEPTDSRCALSLGPDGDVYLAVRRVNDTGFGNGHLHHLVRYDPDDETMTDLGVVVVGNPDYFDFDAARRDDRSPRLHRGFRTLPDGTLAPDVVHLSMIVTDEGDAYMTFLSPFTLVRIENVTAR